MKRRKLSRIFAIIIFVASFISLSQAQITTNCEVGGTVRDDEGAPLPGVTVSAKHIESGSVKSTVTSAAGGYRLIELRSGTYNLTFKLEGFATVVQEGLILSVGLRIQINALMKPSILEESVVVTAASPVIEATRSRLQGLVTEEQIRALPLDGRSWMSLVSLVPGIRGNIGSTSAGAVDSGETRVNVDGVDISNACCGGTNIAHSSEAIDEFQVITNRYDAQFGRAEGAVINAVTKSGTNEFHGSLFGFFRSQKFGDAKGFYTGTVERYNRRQVGFNIGGPIKRDKFHFFLNYENEFMGDTAVSLTGFSYLDIVVPRDRIRSFYSARFDGILGGNFRVYGRGGLYYSKSDSGGGGRSVTLKELSTGSTRTDLNWDFVVGATWTISDTLVNTTHIGMASLDAHIVPITPMPQHSFPSATLGPASNADQWWTEYNGDLRTDFSLFVPEWYGEHDIKWGLDLWRPRFLGELISNIYGSYTFLKDPTDFRDPKTYPKPYTFSQGLGEAEYDIYDFVLGVYIQDDWKVTSRLTLNLGLRYDLEFGISNPGYSDPRREPWVVPNKPYDTNNIAPRFGFAYDLFGNGKTILRAGGGRHYDSVLLDVTRRERTSDGWRYVSVTLYNPSYDNPLEGKTIDDFRKTQTSANITVLAKDLRVPYADQVSIGVGQEISRDISFTGDFVYQRERDAVGTFNLNLLKDDSVSPPQPKNRFIYGVVDPRFNNISQHLSNCGSEYIGFQMGLNKRYSHGYQFQISYTLSWTYDDNDASRGHSASNQFNWEDEWSWSGSDQRHRLIASSFVDLPLGFQLSGIFFYGSGRPIGIYARTDYYGIGSTSGRVLTDGTILKRNGERGKEAYTLDLRISKAFKIGGFKIDGMVETFNVFNRLNPSGYLTNYYDAKYLQPTGSQHSPRKIQLGFRVTY